MKLKIKKMYPDVKTPKFATDGSACFDIHAYIGEYEVIDMQRGDVVEINTGLQFEIPKGYVLKIYSRSGHGFKNNVRLSNCVGVIDSDYRGEVLVSLIADFNYGAKPLEIKNGDRVAQAMLEKVVKTEFEIVDELTSTVRGDGGFGSTGTN